MEPEEQSKYRSGVGKLLHMMKWTHPEMLNAVCELSRFMMDASWAHMKAMYRAMSYALSTPNRGVMLKPNQKWHGSPDFEFENTGRADSDYGKDPKKMAKHEWLLYFLGRSTNDNKKLNARMCYIVSYRSRTCERDAVHTRHAIRHESVGINGIESQKADDIGDRQQRCSGSVSQLEYWWSYMT